MNPPALTLRAIFETHFGYVCSSLQRMGVPSRDVEDVAHEVFLAVHQHLDRYDRSRPLKPWLFAFVFHSASVYRRKAHVRHERGDGAASLEENPSRELDPEAQAQAQQQRALLLEALEHVEPERRAVLVLHDIDETPMPEVAAALSIPLNTGYSRLRLARKELSDAVRMLKARKGGP